MNRQVDSLSQPNPIEFIPIMIIADCGNLVNLENFLNNSEARDRIEEYLKDFLSQEQITQDLVNEIFSILKKKLASMQANYNNDVDSSIPKD